MGMGPDVYYDYGYGDMGTEVGMEMFGVIMAVYLVILTLMLALAVVSYVLHSVGMYTIAKRRGIHHAWLSWLPIGNMWVLGSISDQYQYVTKGNIRSRRKLLLGLSICLYVPYVLLYALEMASLMRTADPMQMLDYTWADIMGPFMAVMALCLVVFALAIVTAVFQYIAYYDLFRSCNPNSSVAFLVLGIIFDFLLPFFVFACRNKDLGMPPRKPRIPAPSVWQAPVQSVTAELEEAPEAPAAEPEE